MNMESEIRNGYTVSALMKEVWSIQLQIARQIMDVCNRHGLKVWADWGTLLGAVREHGFIPWDDDIDLMMMRDDYEKLLSIAPSEFQSPYHFQSAYTDKGYFRGHAQVRYDGTAAVLPDDIDQSFHQGIFVDIFVYDNIPDNKDRKWKRSLRNAQIAQKILKTAYYRNFRLADPVTSVKYLLSKTVCVICGPLNVYRFFEKQFTRYNRFESRTVACPAFDLKRIDKETKEKSWYKETVMLTFEDILIPAPQGYDNVLRSLYGDNYLTPVNNPSGHGSEVYFDTHRSYTELIDEIRNNVSTKHKQQ
ncbi:MAG: LicD family protein [Bacteroidaceae bacterium]|nr:LicD family protein [Bacteroidaceae bacterium]